MKKLLFLIIIMVAGSGVMAQKTQFGVKMGVNLPTLQPRTGFSPGSEYKTSAKFLLGIFTNVEVAESIILQPGLSFSVKGNKSVEQKNSISFGNPVPFTTERNLNIYYFELPINLLYNKEFEAGTVYLGGGPYAAYAIGGRIRSVNKRNTYMKRGSAEQITFGSEAGQLKNSDFGINLTTGFRLKNGMDFGANYGYGLANISNDPGFKSQNRQIGFSLGYTF